MAIHYSALVCCGTQRRQGKFLPCKKKVIFFPNCSIEKILLLYQLCGADILFLSVHYLQSVKCLTVV